MGVAVLPGLQKGRGQVGRSREPGSSSSLILSISGWSSSPTKQENMGLWYSRRHEEGQRQNFPTASSENPSGRPPGVGRGPAGGLQPADSITSDQGQGEAPRPCQALREQGMLLQMRSRE